MYIRVNTSDNFYDGMPMSSPMQGYMHDIKATRVSLVRNPANKKKFLITKTEESNTMDEIIQIITDTKGDNEEAFVEALKAAKGKSLDDKAVDAALAIYRTLNGFRDSLDEADLRFIAKSLGYVVSGETDGADEDEAVEDEEVEKTEDLESVENGEGPADETDEVEKTEEEDAGKTDVQKFDALQAEIDALKSDKRKDEIESMVKGILHPGKTNEEIVDMLVNIDKAGGDIDVVVETLTASSTIVKASIFDEFGSEGNGEAANAYEAMKSAAQAIADEEGINVTQAMAKLHKVRPELVNAYEDEVR